MSPGSGGCGPAAGTGSTDAWAAQDDEALADAWNNELADLDLQRGQYEHTTSADFSA
ncbi:hypothetical protein SALCHL_000023 [Streptomyces albus subsp. chlorinus]|uniref:hypothetical protein n=1 Tax=Streptomyces albus TaxID=1888 RepID=UPI00156E79EF|nr:hypothetical protein [Streptomyces albus]